MTGPSDAIGPGRIGLEDRAVDRNGSARPSPFAVLDRIWQQRQQAGQHDALTHGSVIGVPPRLNDHRAADRRELAGHAVGDRRGSARIAIESNVGDEHERRLRGALRPAGSPSFCSARRRARAARSCASCQLSSNAGNRARRRGLVEARPLAPRRNPLGRSRHRSRPTPPAPTSAVTGSSSRAAAVARPK